jgi:MFS family permease
MSTPVTQQPPFGRKYEHLSLDDGADESFEQQEAEQKQEDTLLHSPDADKSVSSAEDNDTSTLTISIDNAIERIGMGRFQYTILVASGLCFAADAMQVILLSFLTIVLKDEWDLSDTMTAAITSCLFAGSMLGTLILGPLADSMGRRPVFLAAAFIIGLFGLGTAAATNYFMLVAMIFMVGVGVGGLTVPFDILAEFLPSHRRGTNLLLIEYFWTLGCLFVVVLAYMTLHGDQAHWRWFVALGSLPCLVSLLVGFFFVPESARWLCTQGRGDEALQILRDGAAMNGHDAAFIFPPGTEIAAEPEEKQAALGDLFKPKWREITLRLWGAWGAFAFGYYGTLLAITKVFDRENEASSESDSYSFDYGAIFLSSSAELVGTTLVILVVDRIGRIPSQVISYTLAGTSVCLLCTLASMGSSRTLLVGLSFLARVFEMGGTCVTWVSTAEILDTEIRSTGHSTANAMARLGAFFCPFLVEGGTPLARIGLIMLVVHAFTVVCVSKLPETKGKGMGVEHEDDTEELDGIIRDSDADNDPVDEHIHLS